MIEFIFHVAGFRKHLAMVLSLSATVRFSLGTSYSAFTFVATTRMCSTRTVDFPLQSCISANPDTGSHCRVPVNTGGFGSPVARSKPDAYFSGL
ncbi:hypothetical protein C8R47DRAFT_1120321 [Mycena vitilis]|nr:hypothetical protein C8R47DRAFT_1120321 [Mycena vitilis]